MKWGGTFEEVFQNCSSSSFYSFSIDSFLPFDIKCNVIASSMNGNRPLGTMMHYSYKQEILDMFLIPLGKSIGGLPQAWMIKYIFYGTFMCACFDMMTKKMSNDLMVFLFSFFCSALFYFVDVYYINIIVGFLLYKYYRNYLPVLNRKNSIMILIISIVLFVCTFSCISFVIKAFKSTVLAILFVIVVFHSKLLQALFSTRIMQWLGKISFSLYLWHVLLLCTFTSYMYMRTNMIDSTLQSALLLITSLTLLLLISQMSKMIIEDRWSSDITKSILELLQHK